MVHHLVGVLVVLSACGGGGGEVLPGHGVPPLIALMIDGRAAAITGREPAASPQSPARIFSVSNSARILSASSLLMSMKGHLPTGVGITKMLVTAGACFFRTAFLRCSTCLLAASSCSVSGSVWVSTRASIFWVKRFSKFTRSVATSANFLPSQKKKKAFPINRRTVSMIGKRFLYHRLVLSESKVQPN